MTRIPSNGVFVTVGDASASRRSRPTAVGSAHALPRRPEMDAVIVATARTPIGRANKGSLVDCRPDDLSADIVRALLAKVPDLDPSLIEDVIWGCAQPAGEGGDNLARVV